MTKTKTDILTSIVGFLEPLESEERMRIINASLVLLGEKTLTSNLAKEVGNQDTDLEVSESLGFLSPKAKIWMTQNKLNIKLLEQVFHIADGVAEVIAPHIPGKNMTDQTLNAYILTGAAHLLITGEANFTDKEARLLCSSSGCYDPSNHSATIRNKGNEFTGTKEKGWTLTTPGRKKAAELIFGLNNSLND